MTGTTPTEFMSHWIKQTNYPEVAVVLATNTQGNSRVYFLQKRFLMSPEVLPDIDFPSPYKLIIFSIFLQFYSKMNRINLIFFSFRWQVYLKCRAGGTGPNQHMTGNIHEFTFFLSLETGQIDLDRRYSWVKCNNDFRGYYVVDYSAQLLAAFDEVLSSSKDVIFNFSNFLFTEC